MSDVSREGNPSPLESRSQAQKLDKLWKESAALIKALRQGNSEIAQGFREKVKTEDQRFEAQQKHKQEVYAEVIGKVDELGDRREELSHLMTASLKPEEISKIQDELTDITAKLTELDAYVKEEIGDPTLVLETLERRRNRRGA